MSSNMFRRPSFSLAIIVALVLALSTAVARAEKIPAEHEALLKRSAAHITTSELVATSTRQEFLGKLKRRSSSRAERGRRSIGLLWPSRGEPVDYDHKSQSF